jgi:hypothetical protein
MSDHEEVTPKCSKCLQISDWHCEFCGEEYCDDCINVYTMQIQQV